jgi:hypothetical protein
MGLDENQTATQGGNLADLKSENLNETTLVAVLRLKNPKPPMAWKARNLAQYHISIRSPRQSFGGALGIFSLCSRAASAHAQASIRSSRPMPVPRRFSNQVSI